MAELDRRSLAPGVLRALLLLLVLLSAAAFTALVVAPAAPPEPQPLALPARALPALQATSAWPPQRRRNLSTGAGQRYRWPHPSKGQAASLELELLPVRLRRYEDLGVRPIQRLRQRPLWRDQNMRYVIDGADQLALGALGQQQLLQTCWVPGKQAAAQSETLVDLLNVPPPDPGARLRVVLGLEPPRRWECILVGLQMPAGPQSQEHLLAAWRELRPVLAQQQR